MPFITEELWQHIADRKDGESLMVDVFKLDAPSKADKALMAAFEEAKQVISSVRSIRQQKNIGQHEPLVLEAVNSDENEDNTVISNIIKKMAGLSEIRYVNEKGDGATAFMIGTREFAVPLGNLINVEAEIAKAEAQLQHLQGFLAGVRKKLSNERFVANAPEAVVALERKKESDSLEKIAALEKTLKELRS